MLDGTSPPRPLYWRRSKLGIGIKAGRTYGYEFVSNKFYEQTYEGHTYIMNLDFKSKYADTILSACLDSTINMWTLGPSNFSIQEHEKVSSYHRRRQDRQPLGLSQQESWSIKHLLRCLPSQSTHPSYRQWQWRWNGQDLEKRHLSHRKQLFVRTCMLHGVSHSAKTPTK